MTDLWFAAGPGSPPSRAGDVLYSSDPDGPWAVYVAEPVYEDVLAELSQLLSHYGANIAVIGYELAGAGLPIAPALEQWGTARAARAESVGPGRPTLVRVDGSIHLALSWEFGASRAYATTLAGRHLTVIAPVALRMVSLEAGS